MIGPLHPECYVLMHTVDGDAYGHGDRTQTAAGLWRIRARGTGPGHRGIFLLASDRLGPATEDEFMDLLFSPMLTSPPDASATRLPQQAGPSATASRKTRKAFLDRAAADRALVGSYHLPFPGFGHIVREGSAYRWLPADWRWQA